MSSILDQNIVYPAPFPVSALRKDGEIAFRMGKKLEDCPPFRCSSMAEAWKDGFLIAEEHRRKMRSKLYVRLICERLGLKVEFRN